MIGKTLVLAILAIRALAGDATLLSNANIVDPRSRMVSKGSILIRDGKIESVGADAPKDFTGTTVDLTGKFIVPAFSDMHIHANGNQGLNGVFQNLGIEGIARESLKAGVTTVFDLFNQEDEIFAFRNRQRKGGGAGADLHAAGALLTCTGGHGTEYPGVFVRKVNTPAEAEASVTDLAKKNPDAVKIVYDHAWKMPSMDRETMQAAVSTARRLGIRTVVHIGTWQDAREAVQAGASALTHLHHGEIPRELVQLLGEKRVWIIPTMAVQSDLASFIDTPAILDSPLAASMASPEVIGSYRKFDPDSSKQLKWMYEYQKRERAQFQASLKKLADAGARVMTGTDIPNLGTIVGFSVHREMKLLVDAGMSSWQALEAATVHPGEFLGEKIGVSPGSVANLVVLSDSPVRNIENTQKLELVIQRGKVVSGRLPPGQ